MNHTAVSKQRALRHCNPELHLNGQLLGRSKRGPHLGNQRNFKSNINTEVERVNCARRSSYSLMGVGFYGLNGTGTEIASLQYKTYVLPTLLYGLEALVLERQELEVLSTYYRKNLRYIQHLPEATAIPVLYLLIGTLPVEALVDRAL